MDLIKQLALGAATVVLILGLAVASNAALDRVAFARPRGACVDTRGSWRNWPWPNVPTLSPSCSDAKEYRRQSTCREQARRIKSSSFRSRLDETLSPPE